MRIDWKKVWKKAQNSCSLDFDCQYKFGICKCEFKAVKREVNRQIEEKRKRAKGSKA